MPTRRVLQAITCSACLGLALLASSCGSPATGGGDGATSDASGAALDDAGLAARGDAGGGSPGDAGSGSPAEAGSGSPGDAGLAGDGPTGGTRKDGGATQKDSGATQRDSGGPGPVGPSPVDTSCGSGTLLKVPSVHKTIGAALTAAKEGDTILVEPGAYAIGTLTIAKKRITLTSSYCSTKNAADVEAVKLTGKVVFAAKTADGGRLLGVTVLEPNGKDTIQPRAAGTQILFNRLIAANDVVALDGQAGPVVIHGNYIKSNGGDDNIDIDGMFDVTIENNTLDTAAQDGIEMRFHPGITKLQTVIIRGNVIKDPKQDAIQFMDGYGADPKLRKIRIERNVLLRTGTAGVGMNHQSDSSQSYLGEPIKEEIVVLNNSFIECGAGISGGANALVGNNLFKGIKTRALWKVAGTSQVVSNLFFGNAKDQEQSTLDPTKNLVGRDPLLGADFTLGAASPAIDAGKSSFSFGGQTLSVTSGFQKGAAPDLGALEKQ
ncbi:MAG: right-handed parallel beta-helix repeat-containing protein [Deltaproteobacteria bacterium]|nr:right-handed parallel beta-helix repeat-containing protein [Deltaproteobacteria bacterium]